MGLHVVVLAHGAWRDRPLPVDGADDYVDRGLVYQNPFIHWFNHYGEPDYRGPQLRHRRQCDRRRWRPGLDRRHQGAAARNRPASARRRGIHEDMLQLEHEGIPAVLAAHGLSWEELDLHGATLFYRRRIEDMPLAEIPDDADPARRKKFELTRRRILEKAMQKYCFRVQEQRVPVGAARRRRAARRVCASSIPVSTAGGSRRLMDRLMMCARRSSISSIGSVPEPMKGIPQIGDLYRYTDRELGRLEGYDTVFSTGNVVTGKGNILASRKHSVETPPI